MAKEKSKFNFSQAFDELESIVEQFEKGELDLESGLKKFEQGMNLAQDLKKHLSKLENKVEEIKLKFKD